MSNINWWHASPAIGGMTRHPSLFPLAALLNASFISVWSLSTTTASVIVPQLTFCWEWLFHLMFQNIHLIWYEVFVEAWLFVWRCSVIRGSFFTLNVWPSLCKRGQKSFNAFTWVWFCSIKKNVSHAWSLCIFVHEVINYIIKKYKLFLLFVLATKSSDNSVM